MGRLSPADRLFERMLLGLLVSGFLALAVTGELHPAVLGLCIAGFTARILLAIFQKPMVIPPVAVNAVVILYAGLYPLDIFYFSGDFLAATVRLICLLTLVKGLTFQTDRDALYAVLIGFTQILAAALLSASLLFFVFLTSFLFCGVGAFSAWEIRRGARGARPAVHAPTKGFHRRLIAVSVFTSFGILLFTVGLFFILPRTARAALQNLVSQKLRLPGFGGEVDLRKIGEIQASGRAVMYVRVKGYGNQLPFHWRGSSMARFDGKRWTTGGDLAEPLRVRYGSASLPMMFHGGRNGTRIKYEVQLAETGMNALFVAGIPELIESNLSSITVLSNGTLRSLSDMPAVLRYSVTAFIDSYSGDGTPILSREDRRRLLEVPAGFDRRIISLTQQAAGSENIPALQSQRIAEFLQKNYAYTLELPAETPPDPVANFLFERRKGHCEYFASSMALMLRAIGIPSRVVTGFQGGTLNPVSGWYTLRASDAHSWVEAFLPGNGWTTFDPTPAGPRTQGWGMFTRIGQLVEAADLFWQDWVLQYDLERQFKLASQFEHSRIGARVRWLAGGFEGFAEWRDGAIRWIRAFAWPLAGGAALLALAAALGPMMLRRLRRKRERQRLQSGTAQASDATVIYQRMLELLEENDIRKPGWFTPLEFARKLPPSDLSLRVAAFTHAYNRLRYGADRDAAWQMLSLYDDIEQNVRRPR